MKLNKSIILVIFFGLLSISLIFIKGMPFGADFNNHFGYILPFYDELSHGNYLPGWLAESNNGFGDPRFRFYPPFLYYLLCLAKFVTNDWYSATLIIFALFSVLGTLGTYFWAKQSLSNLTSILASLIFAFIPYHLTQFFQASLLAEFAATAILPFAFMFVQRLSLNKYDGQNKSRLIFNIGGLSAVYEVMVTTHLPTTVIASLILGIFALLLTDWKNNKKSLVFCALGVLLGVWASSWFWFRMVSELSWIQAGTGVSSAYYDYRNNFLLSPYALINVNNWYGNLLLILTIGYFLPTLNLFGKLFRRKPLNEEILAHSNRSEESQITKKVLLGILIITSISLLMTTELSRPLWAIIPKLKDIQFPYRWLLITSVTICPILAMSLMFWWQRFRQKGLETVIFVVFLIFFASLIYSLKELVVDAEFIDRSQFFEKIESTRGGRSFNDWLPKNAKELKDLLPLKGNVDAGTREVTIKNWGSLDRTFSVGDGAENQARIRTYNYPHWQAFILKDRQRIQTNTSSETDGTLLIAIPPEKTEVELVFVEPPRTIIAVWISLVGWLIILGFLLQGIRKSM
ncbi:MAG TPA: 6-pyruvoyl-tetrahydropterin synthase-related protein [Pyrinomonadaceae bacterium]|nr:6-pyruvoyl-tetrahydropterin synthase-related protein [Pyrinomonadaceae bacterium]